jgi:hypothetical protein
VLALQELVFLFRESFAAIKPWCITAIIKINTKQQLSKVSRGISLTDQNGNLRFIVASQGVSCGEDTVTVENMDVNRTGEYTLLDLAIDGYYYGQLASNANPAVDTADQAGDEYVNNDDLVFI